MDYNRFQELLTKLNTAEKHLQVSHHGSSDQWDFGPVGFINKETDVTKLTEKELQLAHVKLHMFYNSKNGRNLSKRDIERLHSDIVPLLKSHKKFDRLDK
jgi:hypothetical protein